MQPTEYQTMRQVEDQHWWYAVQRRLVEAALSARLPPEAQVLDAGCGTGGMMHWLRQQPWQLQGVDLHPEAVSACHLRGLPDVQLADVSFMPFAAGQFDAVLSLDVLYHSAVDESATLAEMLRVLRPGGWLLLHLPAFECLRGSHDIAVCGARRYKACHVRRLLGFHSMSIEILHPWNACLFFPILLHRVWSRFQAQKHGRAASDLRLPPAWLNALLTRLGRFDAQMCRHLHLPVGTSWFVVARKVEE